MNCLVCDTVFQTTSPRAKFCSEACKQKNKRQKTGDEIKLDAPSATTLPPKSEWYNSFVPHTPVPGEYQPENGDILCDRCGLLKGAHLKGTGTTQLAAQYSYCFNNHIKKGDINV